MVTDRVVWHVVVGYHIGPERYVFIVVGYHFVQYSVRPRRLSSGNIQIVTVSGVLIEPCAEHILY